MRKIQKRESELIKSVSVALRFIRSSRGLGHSPTSKNAPGIYRCTAYMNAKSLQHLSQKADGVEVVLFTENGKGGRGFLTNSLVTDFQNEYPTIRIKPNPDCHDRLIILDYGEKTELVYHCGASSKDAGKKLCAINQITETAIIHPVIDRLLTLPDKQI